jgi:hypothetical protein
MTEFPETSEIPEVSDGVMGILITARTRSWGSWVIVNEAGLP